MPAAGQGRAGGRAPVSAEAIAEVLFLSILIYMIAGPLSGIVLWSTSAVSSLYSKSASGLESTKNLATQLVESSNRIKTLEKQLADAELELTKLRQESRDTDNLRALLRLKQAINRHTVAADVCSRTPDNWFQQVVIDKGQQDGVRKGSAVITSKGVVGQIVDVGPASSVVRLVSDPDQGVGVLLPRIGQIGVLKGRLKEPAVIEYVPIGTAVDVGDKVTCQSNGSIFPSDHPVGTVCGVRRDTNGTTVTIEVRPGENSLDLTHVLIVPPLN